MNKFVYYINPSIYWVSNPPEASGNKFLFVLILLYDFTPGTGGMLSVANDHIKDLNNTAETHLFGQDYNDEAWALCRADTIIKGKAAENIKLGNTFTEDGFKEEKFDFMLANPPISIIC